MGSRPSLSKARNANVSVQPRPRAQTNLEWLHAAVGEENAEGSILLIGGCNLTDFRVRVAQSQTRADLLPSFWSHAAIIRKLDRSDLYKDMLYEVSLEPARGFGIVPKNNAVQEGPAIAYDDPDRYPNIAWLKFPVSSEVLQRPDGTGRTLAQAIDDNIDQFRKRRGMLDMAAIITEWLGFAWGVSDRGNPILKGIGVPSAVFVESLYAMLGIELTPGLATQSSCPEAIWQAATWWHEFYDSSASLTSTVPSGKYFVGQLEAAAKG